MKKCLLLLLIFVCVGCGKPVEKPRYVLSSQKTDECKTEFKKWQSGILLVHDRLPNNKLVQNIYDLSQQASWLAAGEVNSDRSFTAGAVFHSGDNQDFDIFITPNDLPGVSHDPLKSVELTLVNGKKQLRLSQEAQLSVDLRGLIFYQTMLALSVDKEHALSQEELTLQQTEASLAVLRSFPWGDYKAMVSDEVNRSQVQFKPGEMTIVPIDFTARIWKLQTCQSPAVGEFGVQWLNSWANLDLTFQLIEKRAPPKLQKQIKQQVAQTFFLSGYSSD